MSVSYDRLAERIDELIFELSLINSELNELRKRICLIENTYKKDQLVRFSGAKLKITTKFPLKFT